MTLPLEAPLFQRHAVLPTPLRLGADRDRTGRGVTVAFLDSGFHPHPDLLRPVPRILAYHDVTGERPELDDASASAEEWHGTQTSVVACGSGYLSGGVYRGIACRSHVVLVKVGRAGRIAEDDIARGIDWVVENRLRYGIRVVSISLGGDLDRPLGESRVNQAAEAAVAAGLVVVAAAGNAGCSRYPRPMPPSTAPSVLAVGGWDDGNELDDPDLDLYCSSYGWTADGLVKPELLAPAAWVAAPLLPGTDVARRAEVLARLEAAPDYMLPRLVREAGLEAIGSLRACVDGWIRQDRLVSAHYQHVDGTSFAAPTAASVVAQMLEANPALTPQAVRTILLATARPIPGPRVRKGFGGLQAAAAVQAAAAWKPGRAPLPPRLDRERLVFTVYDPDARSVAVAGEFTQWRPVALESRGGGTWILALPAPPVGRYGYKLILDDTEWTDDPGNPQKSDDGYGGLNSVLEVRR